MHEKPADKPSAILVGVTDTGLWTTQVPALFFSAAQFPLPVFPRGGEKAVSQSFALDVFRQQLLVVVPGPVEHVEPASGLPSMALNPVP